MYYITTYALMRGILQVEDERCSVFNDTVLIVDKGSGHPKFYPHGEWFTSKEKAITAAEKMRRVAERLLHNAAAAIQELDFNENIKRLPTTSERNN